MRQPRVAHAAIGNVELLLRQSLNRRSLSHPAERSCPANPRSSRRLERLYPCADAPLLSCRSLRAVLGPLSAASVRGTGRLVFAKEDDTALQVGGLRTPTCPRLAPGAGWSPATMGHVRAAGEAHQMLEPGEVAEPLVADERVREVQAAEVGQVLEEAHADVADAARV